jgi:two-component system, OmpR family, response regulator
MKTKSYKLLLVEDDVNFGAVLKSYLELNDFDVDWVSDGKDAMPQFESSSYNLVLLDVMLPNVDGFSIANNIKATGTNVPFIFITAKTLRNDIVEGYKTGADDYITKPFDSEILLYKIKVILSRGISDNKNKKTDLFEIGVFNFDYRSRFIVNKHSNAKKTLSPKESELLMMLISQNEEILPKTLALNSIWGDANYFTSRSMDVYVAKLRKILSGDKRIKIITQHGSGYRLITNKLP